jgi:hypothetical protein
MDLVREVQCGERQRMSVEELRRERGGRSLRLLVRRFVLRCRSKVDGGADVCGEIKQDCGRLGEDNVAVDENGRGKREGILFCSRENRGTG